MAAIQTDSVQLQRPVPSFERCEPGSVNIPVHTFSGPGDEPTEPAAIADDVVKYFNRALLAGDTEAVAYFFLEDSYWRDHLALSFDFRTLRGRTKINSFLAEQGLWLESIETDKSSEYRKAHVAPFDGIGKHKGIEAFIKFASKHGTGRGTIRLSRDSACNSWKIFSLFTSLDSLINHEEATFGRRVVGATHGGQPGRKNWQERRTAEGNFEGGSEPAVLIVGAGQAGLTAAARLKLLGVDTLVIDRNRQIGDNWRHRYHHLVLHDPVWYDHMPYLPFPPHWPIFTPKDKLAEWFEIYVRALELNVWTQTTITKSSWDQSTAQWTVTVERTKADGSKESRTLSPKHIIQATGHSGKKNFPQVLGIEDFKGDRLCHSSEFSGAKADGKGKKAVVVGCCNSGHDISQTFYENGYDVTMVQRSSTCVISSESITEIGLKGVYDENGPPVEDADIWLHGTPTSVLKLIQYNVTALQNARDKEILDGLTKVGFKLDQGPDNAGLFFKYFQRGGGYYIDVGASKLISEGKIKIKQGQEIDRVLPHGLRFADGSELEADEIIFATGFQNMRTDTANIFGDNLASQLSTVWGFDSEGELRTIWRNSGHPAFWFMGGNLALCRYYSRLLALQIKARLEGLY
ncbi:hypothetical protein DV738_g4629, partial [Chaetothyriales sp. CBS 135597]